MKHTQTLEKPTTKKASSNLFAIAQQQAPEKKSSKKDKETFQVKGLKNELSRYEELKALIKNSEAEMEVIAGTIKQAGKEKFLEVFENKGKKPESFHIADGEEKVLYIVL